LPCKWKGLANVHLPAPYRNISEKLPTKNINRSPIPSRIVDSPESFPVKHDIIDCQTVQHINLKKGHRHRESPCQMGQNPNSKSEKIYMSTH
jgi:hypothetical protein